MRITLPEEFENRMKQQLGNEYDAYLGCLDDKSLSGLRVNTLKLSPEAFEKISPYPLRRIPWVRNGYFYPDGAQPAKHPLYFAGLYYLQEPSAMLPASLLPISPGDRVLDLCAAPGGKSTELAARLDGEGVLVSNDVSGSRAKALLKNLELFGVKNAVVTSEAPVKLRERFEGYFDKILVDAPCSGEGMFRKSPAIIKNWEQYGTAYYSDLQKQILPEAVRMLKPGGMLLYSTCTFSPLEDEGAVQFLLDAHPEMEIIPALSTPAPEGIDFSGMEEGRPDWVKDGSPALRRAVRLWPHKIKGEGHFIALLRKAKDAGGQRAAGGEAENAAEKRTGNAKRHMSAWKRKAGGWEKIPEEAERFLRELRFSMDRKRLAQKEGRIFMIPEGLPDLTGLRILRMGLLLGETKKNRFEPSQALANALKKTDYANCCSFPPEDMELEKYLKCETIEPAHPVKEGFVLICAGDYPLGWGKASKGGLKNKYFPGWRMM